jgi:uncharacterized protein (DUF2236 family)
VTAVARAADSSSGSATPDFMAPLAQAYERAVQERPADQGLFGPQSLVWRIHRDRSFPLAGIRSLMVQALHPLAMAGVAEHSTWQQNPFGRLAATGGYILTVTYGDTDAAMRAAERVRHVHTFVRGTDPATGLPYHADDPDLLLWVHAGMVDSIVEIVTRYGRPLDAADADRYVAEMVRFAEIVGVPAGDVPSSVAALREYISSVELWHDLGQVAIGTLPVWAREMYGFAQPPPEALEREPVRQLIGAVDVAFETLPGVLEGRERIELRIRS